MKSIINALFRRKNKKPRQEKLNPATARKVLQFLSHGLTYGAQSLATQFKPASKVSEFVAVSRPILLALKQRQETPGSTDMAMISVHVNDSAKQIKLMQVGEHVMLTLDDCEAIISLTTLDQIYANLRDDILKHEEIYGKSVYQTAAAI